MAQLLVRNVEERVVEALRVRAARRGRSAEAEHRDILERALLGQPPAEDFKAYLRAMPAAPGLRLRRSPDRGRRVRL
jgi:plasmid stability protein